MAAAKKCPRCQADVPEQNFALHEARCGSRGGTAPPESPTPGAQASAGSGGRDKGPPPTPAELAQALTWARTRPKEVLEALRVRMQYYRGKEYEPPERKGRCVVTKEGTAAVQDALVYVGALEPMGGLGSASELGPELAAEDHIADIGRSGTASHDSSDGTSSGERLRRYGNFSFMGECLWYGSECIDARTVVLDLIVDDGVATRGHRKGIYNPVYELVGCAYGPHCTFGSMVAMEFATGWQGNDMFIRARKQSGPVKISEEVMAKAKSKASTQWSLGTCPVCNEPIKGGKVVEVEQLGGKLHADCFKCSACAEQLTGKGFKVQAKAAYCTPCFLKQFGQKCTACGEVIGGGTVKCSLGVFHPECVVCTTCSTVIGKASFSTSSGAITCHGCAAGAGVGAGAAASSRRPASRGGTSRQSPLAAAGAGIAKAKGKPRASSPQSRGGATSSSAVRRESSVGALRREGSPGAKARPSTKPKVSMGQAQASLMALGGDYGSLG